MTEKRLVIDFTITEYDDGERVNEAHLRREGTGDYLATAQRILVAMSPPESV